MTSHILQQPGEDGTADVMGKSRLRGCWADMVLPLQSGSRAVL